jgi:hypothetical protein
MILTLATLSLMLSAQMPDTVADPRDDKPPPLDSTRSVVYLRPATFRGAAGTETAATDTVTQRRRAVEYSDWYYKRLTIHKVASYTTIPLFVTEYILGDKLFEGDASSSVKSAHSAVATAIGVLFGVNTVTGAWNWWDSRHESEGRARRTTHALLMLAADAGFVATASLAPEGEEEGGDFGQGYSDDRQTHRAVAISSMGVSLASYLMMYLWK